MANSLKKMFLTSILMITTTGFLHADCESSCTPCCVDSCIPLFIEGDLLYLRAFQGGLSSPCDSTQVTTTTEDDTIIYSLEGNVKDPHFRWNFGYSVGLGYEFHNCFSDIGVYWTHYDSHTGNQNEDNNHKWRIDFNVIDLIYAHDYFPSKYLVLTPFGGLRYAKISQKLHTHFVSSIDNVNNTLTGHIKQNFQGVGPLFGIEADQNILCGLSLYGNIAVGALFGTFDVNGNNRDTFPTAINLSHLKKHGDACQPVIDAGFGLRWGTWFCNNTVLIIVLGVEMHRYFNQNQFCGYGDLNLDGANFSIGLGF